MRKIRLATVWLDGCSGCHMSLLDIDESLALVAEKADIVYGPLVDAQEFPEEVDVTLVEGAVSSQSDLKMIQNVRARTRLLVALGDCAVTGNRNGTAVHRARVDLPASPTEFSRAPGLASIGRRGDVHIAIAGERVAEHHVDRAAPADRHRRMAARCCCNGPNTGTAPPQTSACRCPHRICPAVPAVRRYP